MLRPNELVLPSHVTELVMNNMGAGNTQHFHLNYHGYEGQRAQSMKADSRQMLRAVQREMRGRT